jgi:serine/threonine protein kinase
MSGIVAGGARGPEPDGLADRLGAAIAPEFRLLRPLGEGVMALVYLAREPALERLVAVKVLRPELASDDVVRQRFLREARAAARVVYPNIVAMHRISELPDGSPYLIMEYVDGRTLADVLASEGPLEAEHARALLEQVAGALAAAHLKGIIHRDVRPGNVMVENDSGRAVLTDFGLAGIKETGSDLMTRLTSVGEMLGDPRYCSPEQLLGERVTEETDIYSFGIVGYEVVSGAGPFDAATPRQHVAAHLQQPPRPLAELRADVTPGLARLLERCLSRKPEHRPRAIEVRATLATLSPAPPPLLHASSQPAATRDPPFFPALSSFLAELRRRRVYRAAAAYLAVAFVTLEAADIVFPTLPLPAWALPVLVAVTLAAFPVVLVLTWIFDLNRGGIERTPAQAPLLPGDRLARRVLQSLGIALSLLAAVLLAWWVLS